MQAVDQYVADAEAEERRVRDGLRPGDSVTEQLQAQRQWARTKGKLDAADDGSVTSTVQRLVKSAAPAELAVYAEEMPAYLEGRQVSGDFLDDVLGQAVPELGEARTRVRVAPLVDPRRMTGQRYA